MKTLVALSLIIFSIGCQQNLTTPEPPKAIVVKEQTTPTIADVIPPGYEIVRTEQGQELIYQDLNGDGKIDAAVLIVMQGDPGFDQAEEVLLMIYTSDRHGQFQLASHSNNLGGASLLYANSKSLSVRKNVISYFHQSMRHDMILKFRYDKMTADFMLIGKDYNEYGSMEDGPRRISINYSTGVKLINESEWDDRSEEVVELPEQKESFNKELESLRALDWETIYDDL